MSHVDKAEELRDLKILIHGTPRPDIAQIKFTLRGSRRGRPAGKYPTLQVHPGRRCNLNAALLFDSGRRFGRLDIDLLRGVVADAAAIGYRVLSFRRRAAVYPSWENCFVPSHAAGLATTVTTNGMLLDRRKRTSWG